MKTKIKKSAFIIILGLVLAFSFPVSTFASAISIGGVVHKVNEERAVRGENELIINFELQRAAQWKADDMLQNGYWEHFHNGKSPWDWIKQAGYNYIDAGENLAIDFDNLEDMHTAWMNSPSHRENIINNRYKEIGVGIAKGYFIDHETIIVVQMFGNPTPREGNEILNQSPAPLENQGAEASLKDKASAAADEKQGMPAQDIKAEDTNVAVKYFGLAKRFIFGLNSYIGEKVKSDITLIYSHLILNYSAAANNR